MAAPATTAAEAAPAATSPWRERLRAKRRRRVVIPIQVSEDPGNLALVVARRRGTCAALRDIPTPEAASLLAQAEADLAEAEAALAEHVVEVPFESMPPADFEALIALHPSVDPADDSGIAWRTCLPALAAGCCAEEDGGDEAWWAETLDMDCWTSADLMTLWGELLRLHTRAPSARLPFA